MKTLRATLKRSMVGAATRRTASQWARSIFAMFLAGLLAGGPLFAQTPAQNPPANPAPTPTTAADGSSIAPVASLGLGTHNYTHGPSAFPNILKPYEPIHVDAPMLINSPRLDQLVHDGKLELTLQDAVELALENSMDIAVQRYYPWMADAGILNAQSGQGGFGTPGATISNSSAAINPFALTITTFDPIIQSSASIASVTTPVNNPFTTGNGVSSGFSSILSHSTQFNTSYSQTFETGTNFSVAWDNNRSSSTAGANLLNPYVQSTFSVSFTQPLLNGFGLAMG